MWAIGANMSNGDFDGGYSQLQQQQQVAPQQVAPPHAQQPGIAHTQPGTRPKSGLLLALSILSGVLLLSTIVFAGTTVWLFSTRGAPAQTEQKPTGQAEGETDGKGDSAKSGEFLLGGVPLEVVSDLKFASFGAGNSEGSNYSGLYATVKNENKTQAATAFFDFTAYDKENRVIARTPSNVYLLPGQTSMYYGVIDEKIAKAERLVLEQTSIEFGAPVLTGGIKIDDLGMDEESGYVLGNFTASLSATPEYPDFFIAGFDGDQLVAACQAMPDIPAEGAFEADCILEPLGQEKTPKTLKLPKDAEFKVYLALDNP